MGASNDGKVVIQIEGEWKKFFKQAQGAIDNVGESISDELYQSMEQAFSRLSKIDIDAKLVSVFNRFQNAISKTKDPLKIQDAIRQFDESAKFFESIEKMASSNGINNVFLGIDKDGLKDFISLADKVIAKQQELLKYDNSTKEYSRNYDEMIGENGKYTLKSLDDVVKFAGYKSSDKKESISKVTDFFEKRVVGKIDKHKDTINEFGKLVGLLEKLESQEFGADDIRSVQKEMGLDIIRDQIRNLFNNSNDTTKKLINQYAKDNKVKLGIKKEPYDLQKDYGNFARATTDRINSDINDITQQAYTLILNEAQKVSESFQDRDKQIGAEQDKLAKVIIEAFNQLDETFKKKYSTKDISEIKDKLKAAYEKFASNYKGGKLTDDTFNDLKEVIGYYQRFLTLGGTESDMLGFDWFNKNHRTLVTGTSKHLTSTSYGKEIDELSKNIQLLSQVIDQVGTGVGGSGAGIGGGSGDGSGNGSGLGDGSGNGGFGSGVDKESLNEFTTAIVSKLEELKTVVNEIKNNTEQNKSQNTDGIDMNALADSIYETTTNTATIKNNTNDIVEIKRILEQEINTVINTISTSISGIDLSSIDNHLSKISSLLDDVVKLNPSIGGQNDIVKSAFGDVIDIIIAQMKSDRFLMANDKETYERAMYFGDNFISDPFFHGGRKNSPSWLIRKKIVSDGDADKVKYKVHTHPSILANMSFPFFDNKNELHRGDIKSFYNDHESELDIEEQLIASLNNIQVFLSKKFYNEHSDLLSKNYKIRDKSGNDVLTDFYESFATDRKNYRDFIEKKGNLVANKEKILDAHSIYGTFDEILSSVNSDKDVKDNVKKIFESNMDKYIKNIKDSITDGNSFGDDVLNSILQSLTNDGVDISQAKLVASLSQRIVLENENEREFNKAISSIITKHLLSTKKYGRINLDNYTENYSLSNEEDVKFLHKKYGNQIFNALKQEQENINAGIGISPDFDPDEFINQIVTAIGDKKIPLKVSPEIDPEDFIQQIITAIGEKKLPIKITPDEEGLNEFKNIISSKLSENEDLEKLNNVLGEIIKKIEIKNNLFKEEQKIVSNSVGDETSNFDKLNNSVEEVIDTSKERSTISSSTSEELDEEDKKEQRNLETLKEKVDYLKEMKTLYEFLYGRVSEASDTGRTKGAEDKLHDWTEWGYDAGGDDKHKPKSNEQSINRINDYEELEEKIKETKSVLEDFDMTYEEIIVTMKDGNNVILQTSDDFDKIALDIRKIKDVQFVKDFSTEIDNVHDLLDEIHAYDEENVNKQLFPPVVNFLETEEEIQDAISSLKSYKKELEDVLNGEVFSQLKSGTQDEVRNDLNYINTLIKSTESQLDVYRRTQQQTDEGHQDNKTDSKPSYLSSLSSSLDEVIEKVKEKNDLLNKEQSIVSTITESEVNDLNKVRDSVNEISEAVERKNNLLNDVQQSPTSLSPSVELNEEKSENDPTTSTEPTNIISFEELAKEEIEYTKNQIKGLKDYIFNTNSDECGLFTKYLFGEDGNLKTEKQVIAELETMIDEFYKGTRTDTEEIFRLWRAAESVNLLKGYNFDYKYMRPSYNEWLGNHDDNNQWITETERMSDEAHSMLGHLVEEEEKLSVLQKNNGEDFVNYLKEAKELKEEIYPLLDKYKNYSPSGRDAILDSDITQEHAKEKGDLLEKESDKAEELIKKYEILIEKYNEFKKNRNISDIENDPLKRYNIVNDLKDLSDKLYKESEIYSNISTLRHTSKIGEQLSIYENDTRIDKAYSDNKLYPIAERIDTGIYRGEISAQEGIEKFIAKAKELGYEFDEVANKWVRVENEVSSPIVNNPIEEVVDESKKHISELEGELENIAHSFAISFKDDAKYDFEFEKNYEIANRLKNVLEEIYKIDPSYSIEDLISRTTTSLNDAKKDIANFENILREVRKGTGKWSKNKILNNPKEFADDLIATAEEYKTLSESSERDEKALLNVEARFNAMLSAQHQLFKSESEYCEKVYKDTQNMIRDTYAEELQEYFWNAMANGANMSSKSDLDFIVRDRLGIRYGDLMSEFDINNLQLLLNLLNNIDKVQDKISKESMVSDQQKVVQHEFEIAEELSNRLRSTPEEIRNDDVEWVENQYKYIAEHLSNVEKAKAKIAELNEEIYEFKEITADDVKSNFWNIDVQEPIAQEQLHTPSSTTDTSSKDILDETERLKELSSELEEVERRVGLKTMAFVNEKGEVEKVVNIEKSKLNELKESVESVSNSVNDLAQGLKEVSEYANNTIKLEVTNKDGKSSTSTTATTSSTDGLNNDTILNEQFFNIDDLKEKNKGVAELEKRLGGVLDVVKQIRKGKDGDYVSFRLTGENGSAWVGANGDVLRLTTKDKTDYTDKKAKEKQDKKDAKEIFDLVDKQKKAKEKETAIAKKEQEKQEKERQKIIEKGNAKIQKREEKEQKDKEKQEVAAQKAKEKKEAQRQKLYAKDAFDQVASQKKEQEKQEKAKEKQETKRQNLYAQDAFKQARAQKKEQDKKEQERQKIIEQGKKKIQQREEAEQKSQEKKELEQAKANAKRRINAIENTLKLSDSENKYFTDSYYKNLFESQVGQFATATFKDQKDATHWQGVLVDNEMQAIIDAQSKLIDAEKEFDKVKKNFDNDSVTYADRYDEVVKKLSDAREEFAKLNADEFYKGNKTGISNDLVEKYEKQNTILKDTLLARESRNNSSNTEGTSDEKLEKRKKRMLELINVFDMYMSKINSYPEHAEEIKQNHEKLEKFSNGPIDTVADDDLDKIERLGKQLKNVDKLAKENRIEKLIGSITEFMRRNSKMSRESADEFQNLISKLKGGNLLESEINDISTSFEKLKTKIRESGEAGRSFFDVFKQKIVYVTAQQLAMYFSFNDIIRYARTAAQSVINLNTQFTELAKVSDTSIKQLESDFSSYANTAKEVGGTISDTISATADWARMGYNLPDSKELSRVALIYKNVGDGIDINTANESLISTLKGFQMEASDAMEIIDKFNEVSNNFAISSSGIGEALQRSAASFYAANTDLSKSVALVTTANTVLQDPQVVGNMWKTMSARIRGAKTELEDLGEEEDEFTESTSKLRNLVMGLTGFDIMEDKDTFKDIYDIMIGIGKKWQDLTDIERASLGEALAGKRMANGLYAVLNNIDDLEKAYATAEGSAGSAMREQERYQQSIQYSIDQTKASLEELASTVISSDLLKYLVNVANAFTNIATQITKFGGLTGLIGGGIGFATGFTNKSLDIFGVGTKHKNRKQIKLGRQGLAQYTHDMQNITDPNAINAIWNNAFENTTGSVRELAEQLKEGTINADQFETALNGLGNKAKTSTNLFSGFKNVLLGIANGVIFGLISTAVNDLISTIVNWDNNISNVANNAVKSIDEYSDSVNNYKSRIDEVYKVLNDNASTDEQVIQARRDLLSIQDEMIAKYGDEKGKIEAVNAALKGQYELLEQLDRRNFIDAEDEFMTSNRSLTEDIARFFSQEDRLEEMQRKWLDDRTENIHIRGEKIGKDLAEEMEKAGASFAIYSSENEAFRKIDASNIESAFDNLSNAEHIVVQLNGSGEELNNTIYDLREMLTDSTGLEGLNGQLSSLADRYKDLSDEYGEFAKKWILYRKILSNEDYENDYLNMQSAYDKFREAKVNDDRDAMDSALFDIDRYRKSILKKAKEDPNYDYIENFINGMFKDIEDEFNDYDFRVNILPQIDTSSFNDRDNEFLLGVDKLNEEIGDEFKTKFDSLSNDIEKEKAKIIEELNDSLSDEYGYITDEQKEKYAENILKQRGHDLETLMKNYMTSSLHLTEQEADDFYDAYSNGIIKAFDEIILKGGIVADTVNKLRPSKLSSDINESILSQETAASIKANKDTYSSIIETYNKLLSGDMKSSEIIDFLGDENNKEFLKGVDNLEDALKKKLLELKSTIKTDLAGLPQEYQDIVNEAFNDIEFSMNLEQANASLDKLQEGLKTLSSAFEEYNESGYITLDTFQSLMAENGEYIQMLTIENGQLKINEDAYKAQIAVKLNDYKAILDQAAATEIQALAEAKANGKTEESIGLLNAETIALGVNTKAQIARAKEVGVSDAEINAIISKYDNLWNTVSDSYMNNFKEFSGATTSSASDAADKLKEELDNYIAYQDALLDAGKISYDEYTKNVRGKLDNLYSSGKLTAKDYFDYVQKLLEKQLSIYDEVLSAVARRYDKEIEKIDKQIEAINEENDALNKQKDEYDKILSVVQEVYDKEIESLQDQQQAIQDKIDALQKANDEEDRALALANARYALEKAQQQRTRLVYNGAEGFVYQTDPEAIRNAKKELKDTELENTIAALEDEKEALDKTIETLEEYKEKWSEVSETYDKEVNRQLAIALWGENYEQMILQNREQDIQDFTNKYVDLQKKVDDNTSLIESFEEKKKYYEELKAQWQEITDIYKNSIEDQHTAMVLGADWENEILSGRTTALEKFKNEYISIQEQIKQAAIDSANAQAAADKGGSGGGNSFSMNTSSSGSNSKKTYYVIDKDGNMLDERYYNTREEAELSAKTIASRDPRLMGKVVEMDISGFKIYRKKDNGDVVAFGGNKTFDSYDDALKALNDPNSEYQKKIKEGWKFVIQFQKFAKGGVINANNNNPLNSIASKLGEDTAVLARHGERILTPVQNQYWEKWTNAIPNLTKHLEKLKFNTPNLSSILNAVASKETTVKQEISISLPNVTNTSGAEYVLNALKTLPLEAVQRVNRR